MGLIHGANPMTGGIRAITPQPKPREPRHRLAGNYSNPARPGACPARFVSRRHRLSERVIRCGMVGFHRRKQGIGAGTEAPPGFHGSAPDRQKPDELLSESLRGTAWL